MLLSRESRCFVESLLLMMIWMDAKKPPFYFRSPPAFRMCTSVLLPANGSSDVNRLVRFHRSTTIQRIFYRSTWSLLDMGSSQRLDDSESRRQKTEQLRPYIVLAPKQKVGSSELHRASFFRAKRTLRLIANKTGSLSEIEIGSAFEPVQTA